VNLSVKERLILLSILPQEGNFITLKVVRKLREALSFSEEEIKKYKFVQSGSQVTWDNTIEQGKEIEIGEKATDIITETLKKLDEQKKLKDEYFSVCEKFINL